MKDDTYKALMHLNKAQEELMHAIYNLNDDVFDKTIPAMKEMIGDIGCSCYGIRKINAYINKHGLHKVKELNDE